jgi:hypothetical protein
MLTHTSKEKGLWRGWLKNGQSLELNWGKRSWEFGAGILIQSNDSDMGDRMLCLKFWRFSAYIPLGIVPHPWPTMDGPQWSAFASKEFGLLFHWGIRRKSFDWPWDLHTLEYQMQMPDGSWCDVFNRDAEPYSEHHSYTYVLKSGKVQSRTVTVSKRRHVLCRRAFKALRWPQWNKESIDIRFSDEVGERSGSWKGGTIGCSYDLKSGETMLDALRRMECERVFR